MKVYLIGSHCTGKSTLARYISRQFQLPMITETARQILAENEYQLDTLRTDLQMVDSYQEQVYHRQILEESKYTSFVSDRSILDILAYSGQHTRVLPKLIAKPETISYLTALRSPDSILFFVRPSRATLRADGVRENPDWDGMMAIDAMLKLLLEQWNLRYFQINSSSMQERVSLVNSILDFVVK